MSVSFRVSVRAMGQRDGPGPFLAHCHNVAEEEDTVDKLEVLSVLGAHIVPLAPVHLGGARRQLAAIIDVVVVNVIVVLAPTLLVAAIGRSLDDADVVE